MRERIYTLKYEVEFNARYWTEIVARAEQLECVIRGILIIGSLVSIGAVISKREYLVAAAMISAISGLISTALLPAIGWTEKVRLVNETKCRWLDLERQVKGMWSDIEDNGKVTKKRVEDCEEIQTEIAKSKVGWKEDSKLSEKIIEKMAPYYPNN